MSVIYFFICWWCTVKTTPLMDYRKHHLIIKICVYVYRIIVYLFQICFLINHFNTSFLITYLRWPSSTFSIEVLITEGFSNKVVDSYWLYLPANYDKNKKCQQCCHDRTQFKIFLDRTGHRPHGISNTHDKKCQKNGEGLEFHFLLLKNCVYWNHYSWQ